MARIRSWGFLSNDVDAIYDLFSERLTNINKRVINSLERAVKSKNFIAIDSATLAASLKRNILSAAFTSSVLGKVRADAIINGTALVEIKKPQVLRILRRYSNADLVASLGSLKKKIEEAIDNAVSNIVTIVSTAKLDGTLDAVKRKDLKNLLRNGLKRYGLSSNNRNILQTILYTAVHTSYNNELREAFNGSNVQIWGYKYLTQADNRVREQHRLLHGVTLPKESRVWDSIWPPNGYNCRCFVVPVFLPTKEKGVPSNYVVDNRFRADFYSNKN